MRYLAVGAGRVPYDWTAVVEGEQCGIEPIPSRMVYIRQGRLVSRSNMFIEPDQMTAADNHPVERRCDFWQFCKRSDFVGPPGRRFFEIRKSLEVTLAATVDGGQGTNVQWEVERPDRDFPAYLRFTRRRLRLRPRKGRG